MPPFGSNMRFLRPVQRVTGDDGGTAIDPFYPLCLITTNGDEDLDVCTLADGTVDGQWVFCLVASVGHANDTLRITPANMAGGDYMTFADPDEGDWCMFAWDATGGAWIPVTGEGSAVDAAA